MNKKIDLEKREESYHRKAKIIKGISRKTKVMPTKVKESGKKYTRGSKRDE